MRVTWHGSICGNGSTLPPKKSAASRHHGGESVAAVTLTVIPRDIEVRGN